LASIPALRDFVRQLPGQLGTFGRPLATVFEERDVLDRSADGPYEVGAADFFYSLEHWGGPAKAIIIGPMLEDKVVYGNTTANLASSLQARVYEKKVEPTLTDKDKRDISRTTQRLIDKHFTKAKILASAERLGMLEKTKSNKWSEKRFEDFLQKLLSQTDHDFSFKANIKSEPMPFGKAPRTVIDEGGEAQIKAGLVIAIVEDILFHAFPRSHIKYRSKREAMDAGIEHLNQHLGQVIMEGDGSAWDACCNALIRSLTENLVLKQVTTVLLESGCPIGQEAWLIAHMKSCQNGKMKLRSGGGKRGYVDIFEIDAIRRSGHRGTSVLNFLMNLILSLTAIYENPFGSGNEPNSNKPGGFLDGSTKAKKDRWGIMRAIRFMFEGDDSIYSLFPRLTTTQMAEVEAFWTRCGHRLKLFMRDGSAKEKCAEFTGWILPISSDGLIMKEYSGPDVLRGLSNSGITVSREAIDAFEQGNTQRFNQIAAASYLAYAEECCFPSVRMLYYSFAEHYGFQDGVTTLEHATRNQRMVLCENPEEPVYEPVTRTNFVADFEEAKALIHIGFVKDADGFCDWLRLASSMPVFGAQHLLRGVGLGPYTRSS
jgi:hypothetical protein